MRTIKKNLGPEEQQSPVSNNKGLKTTLNLVLVSFILIFSSFSATAHCDSYDGPTIKDAQRALETNNVDLVLKWISPEQESEVISLFNKTYALKSSDKEIYDIVEKHFFETVVRLHRETEGAPYTGLKPAGTTKRIILLSDKTLEEKDISEFLNKLNTHIGKVIKAKYEKVIALNKVKNETAAKGREYVKAYVDYTHTIEAIHDMIEPTESSVHAH